MAKTNKFCKAKLIGERDVLLFCECEAKHQARYKVDGTGAPIESVIYANLNNHIKKKCTCKDVDEDTKYKLFDNNLQAIQEEVNARIDNNKGPELPLQEGLVPPNVTLLTLHERLTKIETVFEQFRKVFADDD
jgi:hypothetical protein